MPGLVKIGMTTKNPRDRLKELYTTGVPHPFSLLFEQHVKDARQAEKLLHHRLSSYRLSKQREFFQIEPGSAVRVAERTLRSMQTVSNSRRWFFWLLFVVALSVGGALLYSSGLPFRGSGW
jgi:anaerobic glycerol-3-phosphate dehydrogenase